MSLSIDALPSTQGQQWVSTEEEQEEGAGLDPDEFTAIMRRGGERRGAIVGGGLPPKMPSSEGEPPPRLELSELDSLITPSVLAETQPIVEEGEDPLEQTSPLHLADQLEPLPGNQSLAQESLNHSKLEHWARESGAYNDTSGDETESLSSSLETSR